MHQVRAPVGHMQQQRINRWKHQVGSMPIYEYRCASCSAELEKLRKISDPPLLECPECGRDSLVKLISASSFRLKGSGWYETDFKTGKKKNGAAEAANHESTGAAGTGTENAPSAPAQDAGKESSGKESGKESGKYSRKESGRESARNSSKDSATKQTPAPTAGPSVTKTGN